MTEDMRQLRRTIERIARETLPELRAAIEQNVDEDKLVALLASRVASIGIPVAIPETQTDTTQEANRGDQNTSQMLATLILMNDHIARIREVADRLLEEFGGD